ncbi:MAG: hydroxymethylbilane synthase [Planctomycetes bacterium]|nr:hydroxymethylbilane synthase [Planctomycetota bacterium]
MNRRIRIGTRGSGLALTQTGQVAERLVALGLGVTIETISTQGDVRGDLPLTTIGGDGVFVRELERALLEGRIDVAVHSLKDLPTAMVAGLAVGCVPTRATPFDAFVGGTATSLAALPRGAVLGTSSIRRVVQVRAIRPDLDIRPIRGNVDTRLGKLDAGDYHGLLLAAAGLERLGLGNRIDALLQPPEFWPAVGQGALALQVRADDAATRQAIAPLDDPGSHAAVLAERACLARLSAGCLAPVGGWGRVEPGGELVLSARVLVEDDAGVRHVTREERVAFDSASEADPVTGGEKFSALGTRVAVALLAEGAGAMLDRMRHRMV